MSTANVNVVTITRYGVNATVQQMPPMNYPRSFPNSVVLPDGKVLVVGGQVIEHRPCAVLCDKCRCITTGLARHCVSPPKNPRAC